MMSFSSVGTPPSLTTHPVTPPTTASMKISQLQTTEIKKWRTGACPLIKCLVFWTAFWKCCQSLPLPSSVSESVPFTLRSWRKMLSSRSWTSVYTKTRGGRMNRPLTQTSWIKLLRHCDLLPPHPPSAPPWRPRQRLEVRSSAITFLVELNVDRGWLSRFRLSVKSLSDDQTLPHRQPSAQPESGKSEQEGDAAKAAEATSAPKLSSGE